ncbi:MAG TPA: glutamine synthetase, partial [Solirubrobacterales bacterium]|nr:glutamine synthetase [Solirubrobacterales bacterium]
KLEAEQCGYPPDPPRVSALAHGFQYLTENRGDEIDDILQYLSQTLERIGVPVRSMEDEWGPGQVEITFDPRPGLEAADALLLFRTAVKQICRRRGLHATFMARPGLPNFFSSGWHLHQSLNEVGQDRNAFTRYGEGEGPISAVARSFAAGILQYADASAVFTNPTVTGYKRFQPNSFAPTKATWAYENRGAMIRVIGAPEDSGTHIENRIGEPAANPYLYMGSQVAAGLAGIERKLDPGPFDESPYESDKPNVPASLIDAVNALERDDLYRERFGSGFVDYMVAMKRSEWSRFLSHVTDWEHREYFEVF